MSTLTGWAVPRSDSTDAVKDAYARGLVMGGALALVAGLLGALASVLL